MADIYFNKAMGMKHWLENSTVKVPDSVALAYLDPDMVLTVIRLIK